MIAIKKDLANVPSYLNSNWANEAFDYNNKVHKYEKGDYGHESVRAELIKIYHSKCAYCESNTSAGSYWRVEHYRPKAKYYWLSLSWSNLLLSCEICNSAKSDNFDTTNHPMQYQGESLNNLQNKTSEYDKSEIPHLINPEQETNLSLKTHFHFNIDSGEIVANTDRMDYTIRTCNLNRKPLVQERIKIKNDLENVILGFIYKAYPNLSDILINVLERELEKAIPENEYTAWRKTICQFFLSSIPVL
jgi:uncharacterized protein (TIGR02646 family)